MTTMSASDTERSATRAPTTVPSTIARIVEPSIQPFARTSRSDPTSSGRMPYFAGPYTAAPVPTSAYASHRLDAGEHEPGPGGLQHVADQEHVRLRPAVREGPTQGASATNATRNDACSAGTYHAPRGALGIEEHRDRREQDRVIGERRQKLRAEQNTNPAAHGTPRSPRGRTASTSAWTAG